jgi:hypothetical protein
MSQKESDIYIEDMDGSMESNIYEEKVDQIVSEEKGKNVVYKSIKEDEKEDLIVESFEENWIESSEIDASLRSKVNKISKSKEGAILGEARDLSTPSNEIEEIVKDSIPSSKAEEEINGSVFTFVNEIENRDPIPISSPHKTVQETRLDMVTYVYIYVYIHMNSMQFVLLLDEKLFP